MQRVWILLAAFAATLSYAKPPNIVYIISDDQTWTDYSFMGHKIIETPQSTSSPKKASPTRTATCPAAFAARHWPQ